MRKIYLPVQKRILPYFFAAFVAFATSCNKEVVEDTGAPVGPGLPVQATLQIDVAPISKLVETYSASTGQGAASQGSKTTVTNLWILEFDAAGKCVVSAKFDTYTSGSDLSVSLVSGDRMKLFAVANAGDISFKGMDLSAFRSLKFTGAISKVEDIPYVGFAEVPINRANFTTNDIVMTKIASQVNVSYLVAPTSRYEVKSLQLKNIPKHIYFAPNALVTADDVEDRELITSNLDAVHTYYVAENLQGIDETIMNSQKKVTTKPAMYVEIGAFYEDETIATGYDTKFKMYLGANNTNDFNVSRGVAYALTANLRLEDLADSRLETDYLYAPYSQPESNSYLLAPNAEHAIAIPVSRVNSFWNSAAGGKDDKFMIKTATNNGRVEKWVAKIIWQDVAGNLIKLDKAEGTSGDERFIVSPAGESLMGNALVGVYDATTGDQIDIATATPLWSWHIWVTDYAPGDNVWKKLPLRDATAVTGTGYTTVGKYAVTGGQIYQFYNTVSGATATTIDAGMMDRNLGALSADKAQYDKTLGLYYQWGRKDPFAVVRGVKEGDAYAINSIDFTTTKGQEIEFTVRNPTKYIAKVGDWKATSDLNLWKWDSNTSKSLYDPCPVGWRVAVKSNYEGLTIGNYDMSSTYKPYVNRSGALPGTTASDLANAFDKGYLFYPGVLDMWYPAAGRINALKLQDFEESGFEWCAITSTSSGADSGTAYKCAQYDVSEDPDNAYDARLSVDYPRVSNQGRATGMPVRCVVEKK